VIFVNSSCRSHARIIQLLLLLTALLPGCKTSRKNQEFAYVSTPQAFLRDRVAPVYTKTGIVKSGDRVQVLDHDRRFVKIRTENGTEGWLEQRYLVTQTDYDAFQKFAQDHQSDPVQAPGIARNDTNIHLHPARDAEHLYQLTQGSKVAILKRATTEKSLPGTPGAVAASETKKEIPIEDWWLIRDQQAHVGWVLARLIDVDAPLDIAQYAEGQRLVAFFVLNEVTDGDKKVPQYLAVLTEPKGGMPFDYNQIRVFTWNVRKHRYETAYRERNLDGVLPVTVGKENFDKEGTLPIFMLHVKDDNGNVSDRKYKLNTPIVRRVLAPGEQPSKPAGKRKKR